MDTAKDNRKSLFDAPTNDPEDPDGPSTDMERKLDWET